MKSTFNNTHVTITDPAGNTISWGTAGSQVQGTRKSTPFAASAADNAAQAAMRHGLKEVEVRVKGAGSGRESASAPWPTPGCVISIEDVTPLPHNGCCAKASLRPIPFTSRPTQPARTPEAANHGCYTGPKIKQCRREGITSSSARTPPAARSRCSAPGLPAWCPRPEPPQGDPARRAPCEKQKLKRAFERQFERYFTEAERMKGNTGENLLSLLGRRMDSVVLAGGFATTLAQARQMVNHGHFRVNGKRMTIPSYRVRVGDVITPRDKENTKTIVSGFIDVNKGGFQPDWLGIDGDAMAITVNSLPRREDFQFPIQEQLIVELCSK